MGENEAFRALIELAATIAAACMFGVGIGMVISEAMIR